MINNTIFLILENKNYNDKNNHNKFIKLCTFESRNIAHLNAYKCQNIFFVSQPNSNALVDLIKTLQEAFPEHSFYQVAYSLTSLK